MHSACKQRMIDYGQQLSNPTVASSSLAAPTTPLELSDSTVCALLDFANVGIFPVCNLLVRAPGERLLRAVVDTADLPHILEVSTRWRARWDEHSQTYYVRGANDALLHRVIMDAPSGLTVDHWDHDGLNNRRSNLRLVSQSINSLNRRTASGATGLRGVVVRPNGKFRASVYFQGKRQLLGDYTDPQLAAEAVQAFLREAK